MKKAISVLLIVFFVLFTILISGCVNTNSNQNDNTPVAATVATVTTSIKNPTTNITDAKSSFQSEDVIPSVSWKDFYPEYDEQTKEKLIEKAKDEILRVFPDVDESTLNGKWLESEYDSGGRPVINFQNVDDTSLLYYAVYGMKKIVRIRVDPKTNKIVFYRAKGYSTPYNVKEKLTFDEGVKRSIDLINNAHNEDFLTVNYGSLIVDRRDLNDDYRGGLAEIMALNTYNNVTYLYGDVYVMYDIYADNAFSYSDSIINQSLLHELTTLSPLPDITIDEARDIIKSKISEEYPNENFEIEFYPVDQVKYPNSLVWFNENRYVFSDDSEPVPLAWELRFNDKFMREENLGNYYGADVDAHTGNIIGLVYKDIIIPESKRHQDFERTY